MTVGPSDLTSDTAPNEIIGIDLLASSGVRGIGYPSVCLSLAAYVWGGLPQTYAICPNPPCTRPLPGALIGATLETAEND
jgi:hypothetical protein